MFWLNEPWIKWRTILLYRDWFKFHRILNLKTKPWFKFCIDADQATSQKFNRKGSSLIVQICIRVSMILWKYREGTWQVQQMIILSVLFMFSFTILIKSPAMALCTCRIGKHLDGRRSATYFYKEVFAKLGQAEFYWWLTSNWVNFLSKIRPSQCTVKPWLVIRQSSLSTQQMFWIEIVLNILNS